MKKDEFDELMLAILRAEDRNEKVLHNVKILVSEEQVEDIIKKYLQSEEDE